MSVAENSLESQILAPHKSDFYMQHVPSRSGLTGRSSGTSMLRMAAP
jgi:hypothetical protein